MLSQPKYLSTSDSLIYLSVRVLKGFPVDMIEIPEPQPPFNSSHEDLLYGLYQNIKAGGSGGGGGGNAALTEEITVSNTTLGRAVNGTKFPSGMNFTNFVKAVAVQEVAPTYYQPYATLTLTGSATDVEAGSTINPTLTPSFVQNSAGGRSGYSLKRNGVEITTDYAAKSESRVIGDEIISYLGTITYAQGPVLNTSPSNAPSPGGQIAAGSVNTNAATITGRRRAFYGNSNAVATSANIRGMQGTVLNPVAGTTFTISIPAGATSVEFSYPDNLRDVSSVKYVELSNAEVKGNFVKSANSVNDASGANPIGYKTFKYTPAAPFPSAVTYVVTI
jgi:hypothetical protein